MNFAQRLKIGKEFEDKIFPILQEYTEIKHSSDRIIWKNNQPIFVEIKTSPCIEWQCWLDQIKIANLGYKVIFIYKNEDKIFGDWIDNIKISPKRQGKRGSFNEWTILETEKTLEDLLLELI